MALSLPSGLSLEVFNAQEGKMLKQLGFIIVCLVIGATSHARATVQNTKRLYMPQLTAEESVVANVSNKITNSLTAADSSQSVVSKVIDSSLSYWWENSGIKNTSVGKAADNVEKKMQAEVNLGATGAEKTEHKFCQQGREQVAAVTSLELVKYQKFRAF